MTYALSDKGLDLIKDFEGYERALPDGRCRAYQEVLGRRADGSAILDIPTIGWGCTKGVRMGMIWTKEQAEDALRGELQEHEAIVNRLVTVPLTQGQYDALVSFQYNCGKLGSSTLLKRVNAGDMAGAANQFEAWTKAGGVTQRGLVRRRAAEKALFLTPDEGEQVAAPQTVDEPDSPALKQSRKFKVADAASKLQQAALVASGGTVAADKAGVLPDALAVVKKFAADNTLLLALGGLFVGVLVVELIKHFTAQDVEQGRYTPSGAA